MRNSWISGLALWQEPSGDYLRLRSEPRQYKKLLTGREEWVVFAALHSLLKEETIIVSQKSEKRQGIKGEIVPAEVSLALKSYVDIRAGTSGENVFCSKIQRRI